jgi:hypothetical protein
MKKEGSLGSPTMYKTSISPVPKYRRTVLSARKDNINPANHQLTLLTILMTPSSRRSTEKECTLFQEKGIFQISCSKPSMVLASWEDSSCLWICFKRKSTSSCYATTLKESVEWARICTRNWWSSWLIDWNQSSKSISSTSPRQFLSILPNKNRKCYFLDWKPYKNVY